MRGGDINIDDIRGGDINIDDIRGGDINKTIFAEVIYKLHKQNRKITLFYPSQ